MNFKVTLILLALLLLLGAYLYFFEVRGQGSTPGEADGAALPLYGTAYGEYDITKLEVDEPEGRAAFARTDDRPVQPWEMLLPTPAPPDRVDQVRVNGAATRLGSLTASQVITGVGDLDQYGLNPPVLTATLTISNGQQLVLYAGQAAPVGDQRYLRRAGDEHTVYLVYDFAVNELHRFVAMPPFAPTPEASN